MIDSKNVIPLLEAGIEQAKENGDASLVGILTIVKASLFANHQDMLYIHMRPFAQMMVEQMTCLKPSEN